MPCRVGFLVNPIAGMGGRVGLKGTDDVLKRALELGAVPMAQHRAREMLDELCSGLERPSDRMSLHWLTSAGAMGEDALRASGFEDVEVVHESAGETSGLDTKDAVQAFLNGGAEIVVFCGGDGTARDVSSCTGRKTPILGVPSGVKMYSGVFAISPARAAAILLRYLGDTLELVEADVLDIDEEAYRRGEWTERLCGSARTPREPTLIQTAKVWIEERSDSDAKLAIADHLFERIDREPKWLFLLGAGSTVASISQRLPVEKTLLGIDAVAGRRLVGRDLSEAGILDLLDRYSSRLLVLSPIGAQGFVLGRGNQPLSPQVVRRIGRENILVVATPSKLARTPVMRFDTGDPSLDAELAGRGYLPVVTGYHTRRMVKVEI